MITLAKLNLGLLYFDKGYGTNGPEVGLDLIREAAAAGDFRAQWSLAVFYYNGKGLPKDMTNYIVWTRKAAEQGFPEAQYRLASALASREVVQKDMMAARQWTERAARQGLLAVYDR